MTRRAPRVEDVEKSPRAVVRQSGVTSVVALIGVVSGLVLDLTWGRMFGVGDSSDAFALALRLPLAITGIAMVVANQILVPTFGAWMTRLGGRERDDVTSGLILICMLASIALAALFTVFAHPLMAVMAPGFAETPGKLELASRLTQILAWYIPCVVGAEVLRCWLNANLVIGFPAAMALVLNAVAIGVILAGPARIEMVPIAYVAGSVVQLVAMFGAAWWKGWRPGRPTMRHPEVRQTVRLFGRPVAGAALNPLMRIVEIFIASVLPAGTATILHFGNRLASAIGGTIIFRSIMVTVLPRLSRAFGRGDTAEFRQMTRLGLRLMLFLSMPMTIVGIACAPIVTEVVFTGGKFTPDAARTLGVVMALYAVSFAGSALQRAQLAPFYAMRETKTPLRNTVYGVLGNLILLPPLYYAMRGSDHAVYAVPIAYSASQYVNVAHAWWRMRKLPGLQRLPWANSVAGSLVCGLDGGAASWLVLQVTSGQHRVVSAAAASVAGIAVSALVGAVAFRRRGTDRAAAVETGPRLASAPASAAVMPTTDSDGQQGPTWVGREDTHVDTIATGVAQQPARPAAPAPGPGRRGLDWGTIATAVLGIALSVYTVTGILDGGSRMAVALPVAAIVALVLVWVALTDLETFVLVALTIRSSLDAISGGPQLLLGAMLLAAGGFWLFNRRMQLGHRFPASRLGLAYAVFGVVALLGVLTSADVVASSTEWSRIASITIIFLVVEQFAARGSALKPFVAAIGLAALVPAAAAFAQLTSGQGLFIAGGYSRITGTFDHSNPLAYFSVVVLLVMVAVYPTVSGLTRFAVGVVAALSGVLLLLTYTRSAWLVALIGVAILLWRRRAFPLLGVLVAVVLLAGATPQVQGRFADLETAAQTSGKPANSLAWRWAYWQEAMDVAKPSPIAGVGLRSVAQTTNEGKQPHNDVIRSYVELGIPGLLSYLFVLGMMVWTGVRAAADARRRRLRGIERAISEAGLVVALSVVTLSLVANLMSQVVVMMYAVAVLALSSGAYLRRRRLDVVEATAADAARLARVPRT